MKILVILVTSLFLCDGSLEETRSINNLIEKATELVAQKQVASHYILIGTISELDESWKVLAGQISAEREVLGKVHEAKQIELKEAQIRERRASDALVDLSDRSRKVDFLSSLQGVRFEDYREVISPDKIPEEVILYMTDTIRDLTLNYLRNPEKDIKNYEDELSELFDSFTASFPSEYLSPNLVDSVIESSVSESIKIRENETLQDHQSAVHYGQDIAMDLAEIEHYLELSNLE